MLHSKVHPQLFRTHEDPREGRKTIFRANGNLERAGIAILISDKIDFKPRNSNKRQKSHYIMVKGSTHHVAITIINICIPNIVALKFIK